MATEARECFIQTCSVSQGLKDVQDLKMQTREKHVLKKEQTDKFSDTRMGTVGFSTRVQGVLRAG